ncbi:MAG: hypothetical protein OEW15_09425 [Nitrospirota bacterium]|nr:hypothetical protein [Nitrospirota bacterium]
MNTELYEKVRRNLFGGHNQNAFMQLLTARDAVRGPLQGTPEEFSQILYELTRGELSRRNETLSYETVAKGKKDLLKFRDGSLFRVVRAKGQLGGVLVVVTPYLQSMEDLLDTREQPLARLVADSLSIRDAFRRVADEYRREEMREASARAGAEIRMARESKLENIVSTIENAKSGETVLVRGQQNIDALVDLGFVPSLVDNPDNWIDAEDSPGLRYRHARSGIELLLTGRERFRPIEEPARLEFLFLVHRSDNDPAAFGNMARKYRACRRDGTAYGMKDFHNDLIALVKYPEELKGRTEEDLGLMADEVENVIDRRQELDKGILPYEAVFSKNTALIIDHVRKNRIPSREVRKALDYFEYTGMITPEYRAELHQQISAATEDPISAGESAADMLYDRRVKEIVADVLKKIPKERLTSATITLALTPYVSELGFGRLIKIRERILKLKQMVHEQ